MRIVCTRSVRKREQFVYQYLGLEFARTSEFYEESLSEARHNKESCPDSLVQDGEYGLLPDTTPF